MPRRADSQALLLAQVVLSYGAESDRKLGISGEVGQQGLGPTPASRQLASSTARQSLQALERHQLLVRGQGSAAHRWRRHPAAAAPCAPQPT
jgi:hypothetical protein